MATVQDINAEIGRISAAKANIIGAIEEKGVETPAETPIQDLPAKILQIETGTPNAVKYVPQELTTEQKQQARSNIGAGDVKYFDVTYNLTFLDEIRAAYQAGETLRLLVDGMVVPMVYYQDLRAAHYPRVLFEASVKGIIRRYSYNYYGNGWSLTTINPGPPPVASSQPTGGFLPNVVYDLGELTGDIVFELATPTDNTVANPYNWNFETGATPPNVTWPSGVIWPDGVSEPVVEANKHYEIRVRGLYISMLVYSLPTA